MLLPLYRCRTAHFNFLLKPGEITWGKSYLEYPKGYEISFSYKKLTVWSFDKEKRNLLLTEELTPYKKTTRKERYEIIVKRLKSLGIPAPECNMTKAEERKKK